MVQTKLSPNPSITKHRISVIQLKPIQAKTISEHSSCQDNLSKQTRLKGPTWQMTERLVAGSIAQVCPNDTIILSSLMDQSAECSPHV